jgi:hypothetical protein
VQLKYSFCTPINAVLKNSDKNQARTIADIIIKDQASFTRSSDILVSQGLAKIKIRLTTDHTATGLNSQSYSPAFRVVTCALPILSDIFTLIPPLMMIVAAFVSSIRGFCGVIQSAG